jgi:hypothetical protein
MIAVGWSRHFFRAVRRLLVDERMPKQLAVSLACPALNQLITLSRHHFSQQLLLATTPTICLPIYLHSSRITVKV